MSVGFVLFFFLVSPERKRYVAYDRRSLRAIRIIRPRRTALHHFCSIDVGARNTQISENMVFTKMLNRR